MRELDTSGRVPPGAYLISLSGPLVELSHPELLARLGTAVERATSRGTVAR